MVDTLIDTVPGSSHYTRYFLRQDDDPALRSGERIFIIATVSGGNEITLFPEDARPILARFGIYNFNGQCRTSGQLTPCALFRPTDSGPAAPFSDLYNSFNALRASATSGVWEEYRARIEDTLRIALQNPAVVIDRLEIAYTAAVFLAGATRPQLLRNPQERDYFLYSLARYSVLLDRLGSPPSHPSSSDDFTFSRQRITRILAELETQARESNFLGITLRLNSFIEGLQRGAIQPSDIDQAQLKAILLPVFLGETLPSDKFEIWHERILFLARIIRNGLDQHGLGIGNGYTGEPPNAFNGRAL